jgi:DNA-binding transcriptional MocR family regulator
VNVFNLLNVFFREDEREKVSSSATKLYFFLIYEANRSYWEGPLMLSVRRLSSLLSLSKNTVSKALRELEDRGLIICYPREGDGLTADKENSLTAHKEDSLAMASREGSLKRPEGCSRKESFTANKEGGLTMNKEGSLTTNREDSLKRPEGGSRKDSLTASVEGKGASSSAFWFADLELRETASRQTRMTASKQTEKEKKEVCDKGVRYNVHGAEGSFTANKGGSKYAKFF